MDRQELQQRLMAAFTEELRDSVRHMLSHLQALREAPAREQQQVHLAELYRSAHKLKGAANAVGIRPIEQLSRLMQQTMTAVRSHHQQLTDDLLSLFERSTHALAESESRLQLGSDVNETPLTTLLPEFECLLNR